jgi:TPR repeat protein
MARKWYQQAAADGSPGAATNLASLGAEEARPAPARSLVDQAYVREQANDWASARVLLDQAAKTGDPVAYAHIGYACLFGLGYPRDTGCAAKYFQLAADKGNGYAQVMLGMMFEEGVSVQRNEQKAFALYQQSANNHNAMGLYYLARAYEFAIGLRQPDRKKAIEYYSQSAQQGYERARDMPRNLSDPNFRDFRTEAEYQAYQAQVRAAREAQRRAMANQTCSSYVLPIYKNADGERRHSPGSGYEFAYPQLRRSCTPN